MDFGAGDAQGWGPQDLSEDVRGKLNSYLWEWRKKANWSQGMNF